MTDKIYPLASGGGDQRKSEKSREEVAEVAVIYGELETELTEACHAVQVLRMLFQGRVVDTHLCERCVSGYSHPKTLGNLNTLDILAWDYVPHDNIIWECKYNKLCLLGIHAAS